jgi:hypothetical protein
MFSLTWCVRPIAKHNQKEDIMLLDECCTGIDPLENNDTLRIPLVAVFPHPFHGRLVERVILMVSHTFNYKGIRYRFAWKNSGVAYYFPEAEAVAHDLIPANFFKKKGQMSLPFC